MLTEKQLERMLKKLERFETTLEPYLFRKAGETGDCRAFRTVTQHHEIPQDSYFCAIDKGYIWGSDSEYCWFRTTYTVPEELNGKDLFLRPHIGGYEALLWVNGEPFGTFCSKIVFTGHGNHYCDLLRRGVKAGETLEIALEYYAGHAYQGCAPLEEAAPLSFTYEYAGMDICVKNHAIQEFYFDLRTMNQLAQVLPRESFRRAQVQNALYQMHQVLYYSPADCDWETFTSGLEQARPFMKTVLAQKNTENAPFAGLTGHSHMDTAWLWHVDETVKKCARTYANQLSLMEQYPEYTFVQSSAAHGDMLLRNYPSLFARIKEQVAAGRYEPNGGVWVECDCNITGGESMIRQFLWGQRFTRKHFQYTSNCFWLPDTFGYSAAIPQIMKGCGVDYFLTTKIAWNDTNDFPWDTFYWQGIDGTKVFTHFNKTHIWPDAEEIHERVVQDVKERTVTDQRLLSYGFGDGGGGPQFEMIEMAARCADLEGIPKAEHVLVGDFMRKLESRVQNPNTYTGELYLELHRGTLTNQHEIKRSNRKAELALRDLEFFAVAQAVRNGAEASAKLAEPLYRLLLINQFHDILPGTCIPRAHKEAKEQNAHVISTARRMVEDFTKDSTPDAITVTNTLSFERRDPLFLNCPVGCIVDGAYEQQRYTDLDGNDLLIVSGVRIPAFSSVTLPLVQGEPEAGGAFTVHENALETPFASIRFNEKGYMASFVDKRLDRELVAPGCAFNTFLLAEDLPQSWDNWDVDADLECKFRDEATLLSRDVSSVGAAAVVISSTYRLTDKSTVMQDMFFFADSPEVRFDTLMDWQDDHRFLKTAFDTTVQQDFARHEVQFGYVKRPTTRNNSIEKAKFEVLNHKYSDISETRYGVALLNDCKYAVTAEGGSLRLSLHKGGTRPDFTGDHGLHRCVYAFLPHNCGFHAKAVVQPAYMLNIPAVASGGVYKMPALLHVDADTVIVEAIKPCEDGGRTFIVRLYEAEGAYTPCTLRLFDGVKNVQITNMLEEEQQNLGGAHEHKLVFRPFEIKTIRVAY